LQVNWPGGYQPVRLPNTLRVCASDLGLDLAKLADTVASAGSRALLDRAAALLFVEGLRANPYCRAQFRWNLQDPVARAMLLIEKHPFSAWSVRSLADRVGMGRSNFAARFTSEIGKTPIDALTDERMKYAEQFLRDTDLKIPEIGELIGYRSEAAFVRRFTKHFKITPGRLRRHEAMRVQ
jgi:transcriptional regulator GlxA family with amidase domain